MPLTVHTYTKCSTCRDATAWLRAQGLSFLEKPILTEPPTVPELQRMLACQDGALRRLFNTSGIQYRAQGLAAKFPNLSTDEALALLANDGRLIKRPFLLGGGVGLVGFDPALWQKSLVG